MKKKKIRVAIIESESGWGQKVDEIKEFPTLAKAEAYIKEFNSHNKSSTVPNWYMYATLMD